MSPEEFCAKAQLVRQMTKEQMQPLRILIDAVAKDNQTLIILTALRARMLTLNPRNLRLKKIEATTTEDRAALGLLVVSRAIEDNVTLYKFAWNENLDHGPSDRVFPRVQDRFVFPLIDYIQSQLFSVRVGEAIPAVRVDNSPISDRKIFIVHGRDDAAKHYVARVVEKLGLEAVILHEQPGQGKTIIERFEKYSEVQFAIVLLTPDDEGRLRADESIEAELRARQNVIFEMGYFIGALGRDRVFPLKKGDVKTPSDYDGVVFTPMDEAGAWRYSLLTELKAAGFDVDANKAF